MRSSSSPGFDLRGAVEGLRQTFSSPSMADASPDVREGDGEGGDIRAAILRELSEESMHGYQIIRAIEARSGGAWKPTPGTVYPTLQVLDDEGLVSAAQVGERKVYSLTDTGRFAAAAAADSAAAASAAADSANTGSAYAASGSPKAPQQPWGQGVHGALALTKSAAKLAQVMTLVAQTGTPRQTERAVAVVDEARRKLYAILAEE
ncbi:MULTISPECIES: PadR family transcriptional regulator [unclassified Frondihabitans]|uniref:PadR family transcriptional regulator n=1 Tax=unclassified Frondihabitans TaxID=2626248 RepID=UPI000F9F5ED3|nr:MULTISPECIES: PadR family transcriptional regulator [unclassified Frondihabitans]RPE77912.1 PadR family transcriptional regulator [Frondihabitans sp. PhB153]RPF08192.1 PadR family transcriptional regulator [Frondihabitans sp. PhB161]